VNHSHEQHVHRRTVLGKRESNAVVAIRLAVENLDSSYVKRLSGLDHCREALYSLNPEVGWWQFIEHSSGHVAHVAIPVASEASGQIAPLQSNAKARWVVGCYIDEADIPDDELHFEWIKIGARRKRSIAALLHSVVIEEPEVRVVDRQHKMSICRTVTPVYDLRGSMGA
jgi:hypothetical protein